jgi:hypothetical protein
MKRNNEVSSSVRQPQTEILRKAVLLSITLHYWRNRAEADRDKITADCDSAKLSTSKKLIVSEPYTALVHYLEASKRWCLERSMMSGVRDGIFFAKRDMVPEFEAHFNEVNRQVQSHYIPLLVADLPRAKAQAMLPASEGGLGALYNEADYPTAEQLPGLFSIEHAWTAMSVPNELPEDVTKRECAKLEKLFTEAGESVVLSLRAGLLKIVTTATAALKPSADGNRKIFSKSTLEMFDKFFETFKARNIMDDRELEKLVADAKAATRGIKAAGTRGMAGDVKAQAAKQFEAVAASLSKLVTDMPTRKFDFSA